MADELRIVERPSLRRPILISAFRGWNDGGQGASLAGGFLARVWSAARFAEIDPENFFDFQATRPHVSLVDGQTRKIEWPDTAFHHAQITGLDRDAVLLLGVEPNLRWRHFSELIVDLAADLGVELVITLGAALALCERLSSVLGAAIDTTELEEAAEAYAEQVTAAVSSDAETAAYVEELEQRSDELEEQEIPSGESIAAEPTRYLRDRERGNGGGPKPPPDDLPREQ